MRRNGGGIRREEGGWPQWWTSVWLVWILMGCTPAHDWREVKVEPSGWLIWMPARPSVLTRVLPGADGALSMTMYGAQVESVAYTVATVCLPPQAQARAPAVMQAMRDQALRKMAGRETRAHTVALRGADLGGGHMTAVQATETQAEGFAQGVPVQMVARWFSVRGCLGQARVFGPTIPPDESAFFLDSLRVPGP